MSCVKIKYVLLIRGERRLSELPITSSSMKEMNLNFSHTTNHKYIHISNHKPACRVGNIIKYSSASFAKAE
jgi:hypothetical protein